MTCLPLPLEPYCYADEFDAGIFARYGILKRRQSKKRKVQKPDILDCICAFDIEATNISEIEQAVMYIWQFQVGNELTVFGRTWEEFDTMLRRIAASLPANTELVIYIHNAAYEFSFIKGIYDFHPEEVFATQLRKPLYFRMYDRFEFRCSYRMSNLSLRDFTRKYKVKHSKLSDYDYDIPRYWFSGLTVEEMRYCQNDVLGLVEAVQALMIDEQVNLMNISLTSTGFIRKALKKIVFENLGYNYAKPYYPSIELYDLMRRAFRGGDTHCNRYYVNDIIENVNSVDRSSSYPDVLVNGLFPVEPLAKVETPNDIEYIEKLIFERQRAILMELKLYDVQLKDPLWGDLYLTKDKARDIENGVYYNGRVLSADSMVVALTEIDYMIVKDIYTFRCEVLQWYKSPKGRIPACIRDYIIEQYRYKTSLKGAPGELNATLYMKSKNRLNGIYGLFATAPIRDEIIYDYKERDFNFAHTDIQELFDKCRSGYWLPYQFGVWCTALARYELYRGIKLAAYQRGGQYHDFVYCDTDSVKYIGAVDWSGYNAEKIQASTESGAYADDINGKRHYMGVYESEGECTFKSCGSKKYAYIQNGKLKVTIAGVDKKKGAIELAARGGLEALEDGFVFYEAGGLCAKYNDNPELSEIEVEGYKVPITSNLYLCPSSYTVGTLEIYKRIIQMSKKYFDRIEKILYNDDIPEGK